MKILVTGGAGFIGSNFVRYVYERRPDWKVVNLDKLTYAGNLENLEGIETGERYRFVRGDIADRELVGRLMEEEGIDVVVNFAAESHVDRSIEGPEVFFHTNVLGTLVLLEAARRYQLKRFVQISTDEVYGSTLEGKFTEESPLNPSSPYSASKAGADCLVQSYYRTYGMDVVITRSSNNYGPYQFPEKFLPLMITNALEDKPLPIYGDGLYVRDWIHVLDHCRALEVVIEEGKAGEIYNIGGGNEKANIEVVRTILQILGKPEGLIKFVDDRPGHDRRYALDSRKMERELGWQPEISFEEGLSMTIQWYRDNRGWWERIKSGAYRDYYERMYGWRLRE